MFHTETTVFCDNCGVEITWGALTQPGLEGRRLLHYCCQDCMEGRLCACGERMEEDDERRGQSQTSMPS